MGGCGKHMMHPYDNLDITFSELINFMRLASAGSLEACEKIDGVNIHWRKDYIGQHRFAFNMTDMKNGGINIREVEARLSNHPAREQFLSGCYAIVNQIKHQPFRQYLYERWINTEIVSKDNPQCINYDKNCLVFHDLVYYDHESKKGVSTLDEKVSQTEWSSFIKHTCDSLEFRSNRKDYWHMYNKIPVSLYGTEPNEHIAEIKNIIKEYCLSGKSTLRDYYTSITLKECMQWLPIVEATKVVDNVWNNGKWKIRDIRKHLSENVDIFRFNRISLSKSRQGYRGECKQRMRTIFDKFGASLISDSPSMLIKDSNMERRRLEELIRFNIIQAGEVHIKEHRNLWDDLKDNLGRFESLGVECPVMEGIVVNYKDNKYKLTGAFPSMNRVCGTVRYALGIDFKAEKEKTFANAY